MVKRSFKKTADMVGVFMTMGLVALGVTVLRFLIYAPELLSNIFIQ